MSDQVTPEHIRQMGAFAALASTLNLTDQSTFCDIGGANGDLAVMIASANPHLTGIVFDLAPIQPAATAALARFGVADRVAVIAGDFFVDDVPSADVHLMCTVPLDWDEVEKRALIDKASAGFDHRAQFDTWVGKARFALSEVRHLAGPTSTANAKRPDRSPAHVPSSPTIHETGAHHD